MVYTRIVQPGQRRKYAYKPGETLLLRVSGTVVPTVWRMSLITAVVTYVACLVYDPLRRGERAETLGHYEKLLLNIFLDMDRVLKYLTGFLTFILGFFNSIVFHRWWKMRELCGNIIESSQNTAMHVAVFFVNEPPGAEDGAAALREARRHLVRLLGLAQALALQACHRVRDFNWLIERRLLQRGSREHQVLQSLAGPGYKEVYGWYIASSYAYGDQGMLDAKVYGSVLYLMRWCLCNASNHAEDLMMHLNQQIPLAYCHLLEVMVTIYCFIAPMALVPSLLWMAIVISPIVTLFFYGFFVLGTSMLMDPFQQDSGFDTNSFLESCILSMESIEQNVPLSYAKLQTTETLSGTFTAAWLGRESGDGQGLSPKQPKGKAE
mmetsp:Transcript_82355/g.255969  ORF Transcript_82355/g.255969 Transcript_82355/m.255969 type:complete len:379 (+) Transcript_82355:110-1246(+)